MNRTVFPLGHAVICFLHVCILAGCAPANPHQAMGDILPVIALQRACVSGKVTDAVTGRGIPGVVLEVKPQVAGLPIKTNRDGFFYAEFPGGPLNIRFVKKGYGEAAVDLILKQGDTAGRDVALEPVSAVVVDAGKDIHGATPGSTITVTAKAVIRDGSRVDKVRWSMHRRDGQVAATLKDEDSSSAQVTLPDTEAYRQALLYRLGESGRLLDRFMVLGITPSDLLWAGKVALTATVTTSSGTYTGSVDVFADLGSVADVHTGLQNVAIGEAIFLQGKKQPSYAWSVAAPAGSAAVLKGAATQNPTFIPDIAGTYTIREGNHDRFAIHAGIWNGDFVAMETATRPRWIGNKGCMCHFNDPVTSKFMTWRQSGHAEIFTRCVTTVFRYEERCFTCHTLGFNGRRTGITAQKDYSAFLHDASLWDFSRIPAVMRPKPENVRYLVNSYPEATRMTNVQCEHCHGPNDSAAHKTLKKDGAKTRISLDSAVCGSCHDETVAEEPSFRDWLADKKHSNYNRAIEVAAVERKGSEAADCGRCHAAQGFLSWLASGDRSGLLTKPGTAPADEYLARLGLTADQVHPVTCAVCHDPHSPGSTFRFVIEKVPVRQVEAAMHPPEFGNRGGRGSICITCHSTIWGAYNDGSYPVIKGDFVPHASQSDVLFGQNAFFVETGSRHSHAGIEDTCVWCHIKPVPEPGNGYPIHGASHTFISGSAVCGKCHPFTGEEIMDAVERELEDLKAEIDSALGRGITANGAVRIEPESPKGAAVTIPAADIGNTQIVESDRKPAILIMASGRSHKIPLARFTLGSRPLLKSDPGQVLAKAAWNYFLLRKDGSKGAHNPQFVREVLTATAGEVNRQWRE